MSQTSLKEAFDYLKTQLTSEILTEFVSKLNAICSEFKGDGAGLTGGIITDKFVVSFLKSKLRDFTEHHSGESDCKICDRAFSLKKINGKSIIALDWSKNDKNSKKRNYFETDIVIINLKTEKWWKKAPSIASQEDRDSKFFSATIKAGIYFVPHEYCKANVCLSSNNKTDSLIDNISLYRMLQKGLLDDMFIEFPTTVPKVSFNILNSFENVQTD